jgi:hypothetical protein
MRLVRAYPAAWRKRYGDELAAVLDALAAEGTGVSWGMRTDIVRAGLAERVRSLGMHGRPPYERAREGSLRVLYAWMAFVVGGFGVEKASEHWRAATPVAAQGAPAATFDVLAAAAALGSLLVLAGIAVALPPLLRLIRDGGWPTLWRPILRATLVTVLLVAATAGLAGWAHTLDSIQRNGGDAAYGGVFVAWVALFAVCLWSWAAAAAATARRVSLSGAAIRLEALLGAAVVVAMAVVTAATAVWWALVARAAPSFFTGHAAAASSAALVPNMIVPAALMACATGFAFLGARAAVTALPGDASTS